MLPEGQNILIKFRINELKTNLVLIVFIALLYLAKDSTTIVIPLLVGALAPVVNLKGIDFKLQTLGLKDKKSNLILRTVNLLQTLFTVLSIISCICFISGIKFALIFLIIAVVLTLAENMYFKKYVLKTIFENFDEFINILENSENPHKDEVKNFLDDIKNKEENDNER